MSKKDLSERDICSKYITPAVTNAGWDLQTQIREVVNFTKGRIIVRGKLHTRGEQKRADYILYYKSNIPLAVIEAKDNKHSVGAGMQQALDYAETLGNFGANCYASRSIFSLGHYQELTPIEISNRINLIQSVSTQFSPERGENCR